MVTYLSVRQQRARTAAQGRADRIVAVANQSDRTASRCNREQRSAASVDASTDAAPRPTATYTRDCSDRSSVRTERRLNPDRSSQLASTALDTISGSKPPLSCARSPACSSRRSSLCPADAPSLSPRHVPRAPLTELLYLALGDSVPSGTDVSDGVGYPRRLGRAACRRQRPADPSRQPRRGRRAQRRRPGAPDWRYSGAPAGAGDVDRRRQRLPDPGLRVRRRQPVDDNSGHPLLGGRRLLRAIPTFERTCAPS